MGRPRRADRKPGLTDISTSVGLLLQSEGERRVASAPAVQLTKPHSAVTFRWVMGDLTASMRWHARHRGIAPRGEEFIRPPGSSNRV